jgi:tRNA A37 threonylcarbamoyladenosine synthetase subunit TsaC/SUA5/YrdC
VPTDTIYGIACLACNKESLAKIYSIKGRDSAKPLAICVGNITDLEKLDFIIIFIFIIFFS